MSLALFAPDAPEAAARRGRGRPRAAEDAVQRGRHLDCLRRRLDGDGVAEVAAHFDISERCVRVWCRLASGYPEAEALRRLLRRR